MPDIMHLISFQETPGRVFEALSTKKGIRSWWTADADLGERVGDAGEFRFYDGEKITRILIAELVPTTHIVWEVTASFRPEWVGTHIQFVVRPHAEGSEVLFTHAGFPRADDNYAMCTTGWGIYFSRLQRYLQTGRAELG